MSQTHAPLLCETCRNPDYEAFRHDCVHDSADKSELWLDRYKIMTWPTWAYSIDDASLTFSQDGKPKLTCEMQVAGSVQDSTWQWAWSNNSLPLACRDRLLEVKQFGLQKGWMRLFSPFLNSDEYLGWDCASIASHIVGGESVYRCPTDTGFLYLVILSTRYIA